MTNQRFNWTAIFVLVAALAACGGNGGNNNDDGSDAGGDTTECTPGTLDCACDGEVCGAGLVCSDGMCTTDPECVPGDSFCPCADDGTCNEAGDVCGNDNICRPDEGCAGELGCACDGGDTCDDGLACIDGVCVTPVGGALTVTGGDARACDVVFESGGRFIEDVAFPDGIVGTMRTRTGRTALAFYGIADDALSGSVATVVFVGPEDEPSAVEGLTATCYDRAGQPLDDVTVELR